MGEHFITRYRRLLIEELQEEVPIYLTKPEVNVITRQEYERITSYEKREVRITYLLEILSTKTQKQKEVFEHYVKNSYPWIANHNMNAMENENRAFRAALDEGKVPPLPYGHINRNDDFIQLLSKLYAMKCNEYVVLHGMRGSGKLTLVSSVLYGSCSLVMKAFGGKVIWLSIGDTDEFTLQLDLCGRLNPFHSISPLPDNNIHAKRFLRDKFSEEEMCNCLLILDDVRSASYLHAFDVGCKILITTDDINVMEGCKRGYDTLKISEGFTESETLELFSRTIQIEKEKLPQQVKKIHAICKGFPLTISLILYELAYTKDEMTYYFDQWKMYQTKLKQDGIGGAVEPYNRSRSKRVTLPRKATGLSINSLDQELKQIYQELLVVTITVQTMMMVTSNIGFDYKGFAQFMEEPERKYKILLNQVESLKNKSNADNYQWCIEDLEILFNAMDEPIFANRHTEVLLLICKSVTDGTQFPEVMIDKLGNLLDNKKYALLMVTILHTGLISNKGLAMPQSILSKLSSIVGNKDYSFEVWIMANLTIAISLEGEAELSNNILASFIDNNFVSKVCKDSIAWRAAIALNQYFMKHPRSLEKYSDKIIDIIVDDTLHYKVRNTLCLIVNEGIKTCDNKGWHLLEENIEKLKRAFECFSVNQALEILTILASIRKVYNTTLSYKILEKCVNAIGRQEVNLLIREKYADRILGIIMSGQEIEQSLVMVLIESLAGKDDEINKKVSNIVQYLFKSKKSDYNLSTQEIDVIHKILSNTSMKDIQDTLAYIIGVCASKDVITKNASDSIYELVNAERFTNQILFALKNISENDKRALSVDIYQKLIIIGLNNVDTDLRIFALKSVMNLAECSVVNLSLGSIRKLLDDHNTEIKNVAIKLVKYYFEGSKELPKELVESIASHSKSNELLSKTALEIFSDVVNRGRKIQQQALELCYWILFNHNEQSIRDRAFTILKQCRSQPNFERNFENALVMEELGQLIFLEVNDKQIDAAQKLEKLAIQGLKLTKSCWEKLHKILAGSNVEMMDIVAKIIVYGVDSEIPTDILITLKNCQYLGENRPILVMALYKLIEATSYSDDDIVQLTEKLLISKRSSALIQEYMMLTLKILTSRGVYLSAATIEYISTLLMNASSYLDEKAQIGFGTILCNVVSNGQDITPNLYKSLICSLNTDRAELYCNAIKCLKDVSCRSYNFDNKDIILIRSFLEKDTTAKIQHDILTILKNISFSTKEKFVEVELDAAISGFGSSQSNQVIILLSEVEFVAPKIVVILKNYLGHTNVEIVELAIQGLVMILSKGKLINLRSENINQLPIMLDREGDNENIIKLLENYQEEGNSLPEITRVRLINCLNKQHSSSIRTRIIELLENESLSEQERDLFYLATEAKINVSNLLMKEQELYQIIKTFKSKINFGQKLNVEQYELLSIGLKSSNSKVIKEINKCLEVILSKQKMLLEAGFVETILPIVEKHILLALTKHLLSIENIGVYSDSLLNCCMARFELMIGTILQEQEVLDTIDFIAQQKVSLSPAIIQYIEGCLDNIDLQIAAFKLLKQQVDKGGYNLSDKCWSVINKLAKGKEFKHIEFLEDQKDRINQNEYLNIFTILLDIKYINKEVLNNLSHKYWTRELLFYDVLGRMAEINSINSKDAEDFDEILMNFEAKHKYAADQLLLLLIKLQQVNNYSCKQVTQILRLLIDLPEHTLNELDKAKDIEYELQLRWLSGKFLPKIRDEELQLLQQRIFKQNEWDVTIIEEFCQRLPLDASIKQISNLLKFAEENNIALQQLNEVMKEVVVEAEGDLVNRWQEVLARTILEEYLATKFVQFPRQSIEWNKLIKFLEIGWSIKAIQELGDVILIKSNNKLQNLCKLFKCTQIIFDYKIVEDFISNEGETVLSIIKNSNSNTEIKLHKLALAQNFHESTEKDIETLLSEISLKNQKDACIQSLVFDNVLKNEIQDIERIYNSSSAIFANNKLIKHWSEKDIQIWSKLIKTETTELAVQQAEILAVIKRANILDSGHQPRVVQQLAILLLLHNEDAGRLVQVATGEGKSMIVAMLAVMKALGGEFVDVVTSSSVLAKRDAEERAAFYKMFNLTVGDNGDNIFTEEKDCYSKNIIYGSISRYQFDWLKDVHFGSNIRKNRVFDVVIIDEVDSMLIDEAGHIAKLSAPLPQMEYLEILLSLIWLQLEKIEQHFYYSNTMQQLLWIKCNFSINNGELYLENNEGSYEDNVVQVHNRFEYTSFLLRDYIKQYIINKSEGCVAVPEHLRDFALLQIDRWINSALCAKHIFVKGKHYVVAVDNAKVHKIVPVDFANTGILQFKTLWSNGLHQFLEIKHNLRSQRRV